MEREIELDRENHALKVRVLELESRAKEMELDISKISRLSDILRKKLDEKTVECEDLETKVSDLEEELSTLQEENYIGIPAPRSLTEEMELEERLRL